jgi:hypothetical protein
MGFSRSMCSCLVTRLQIYNIRTALEFFDNVTKWKYLETCVNQNHLQKDIKSCLNLGNAYIHLDNNILTSRLLSRESPDKYMQNYVAVLGFCMCVNHVSYPKEGHIFGCLRFPVLTAASVKMATFWDIAPCNLVEVDGRFRGTYCLHHRERCLRHLWNVGLL